MEFLHGSAEPLTDNVPPPEDEGARRTPETPAQSAPPRVLKISARSRPSSVAGAIAGIVRETGQVEIQSIGARATNQAVKSVVIARTYLQEDGIDIVCVPSFVAVLIGQEEHTAIRLIIEKR